MPKCLIFKNGITFGPTGAVRPCCGFDTTNEPTVKFDDDWQSYFDGFDKQMKSSTKFIPACNECEQSESLNKPSLRQYYNKILQDEDQIQYWDLKINNTCNYACRMCDKTNSSIWAQLLENNPDVDFDKHYDKPDTGKWHRDSSNLISLMQNARVVKFTGGEPFLIPQVKKIIQQLIENGTSKNCKLELITNGSHDLTEWNDIFEQFKNVYINISIDALGKRYEYIRPGADWELVKYNTEKFAALKPSNTNGSIACLEMLLNYGHTKQVAQWANSIGLNFNLSGPIIYPEFLRIDALQDERLKEKFIQQMEIQDKIHGTDWRDFVNE